MRFLRLQETWRDKYIRHHICLCLIMDSCYGHTEPSDACRVCTGHHNYIIHKICIWLLMLINAASLDLRIENPTELCNISSQLSARSTQVSKGYGKKFSEMKNLWQTFY